MNRSKAYMEKRIIDEAKYTIENKATIRKTAEIFYVSKSTVHKDITEKLPFIDIILYRQIKDLLNINKSERHIRGGEATKFKYRNMREG